MEILSKVPDYRSESAQCEFNGYLEDFIALYPEHHRIETLQKCLQRDPNIRIMTQLVYRINPQLVANQIIRYKDIQKVGEDSFKVPYLLYGENDKGSLYACLLCDGQDSYLLAKGHYYALTEAESEFESLKSSMIAFNFEHPQFTTALDRLVSAQQRPSSIQFMMERRLYPEYDHLVEGVMKASAKVEEHFRASVQEERRELIYQSIVNWFLLKKMIYVSTMTNRKLLNERCEGNVHALRRLAKESVDKVHYVIFSDLWKIPKAEVIEEPEVEAVEEVSEEQETE